MSKITIFSNGVSGGGAERVVCELSCELSQRGWLVDLLTMSDDEETYYLSNSIERIALIKTDEKKSFIHNQLLRYKRLESYIKGTHTDIFLVFLPHTTILLLSLRKIIKQPIVVAERSNPSRYPKYLRFLLKMLMRRADGFVFQTFSAQNWYGEVTNNRKTAIIPNAISNSFFSNEENKEKNKTIIAIGRLHKCKNFELLIKSFGDIHSEYPDYSLVIYGEGSEEKALKKVIKELNLSGKVKLPGFSNNIKSEILASSLFVLSSDYEGMPNALIEAMACGIPCISTDFAGGAARFLIEDGINGLIVPVGDRIAMVNAMRKILSSDNLSEKLADNAKKIKKELNPEIVYCKWEQLLKNVMDR